MLVGFVIGCFVGCVLGVFATCLVVAVKGAFHSFPAQRTRTQEGERTRAPKGSRRHEEDLVFQGRGGQLGRR